jgi:hypothetical protein
MEAGTLHMLHNHKNTATSDRISNLNPKLFGQSHPVTWNAQLVARCPPKARAAIGFHHQLFIICLERRALSAFNFEGCL